MKLQITDEKLHIRITDHESVGIFKDFTVYNGENLKNGLVTSVKFFIDND